VSTYDCIVVGGGPAGSAAAISLARSGVRVLLLEAKPIPHDKLCGEFLSPECQTLLAKLGAYDNLAQLGPAIIPSASIIGDNRARWTTPLPGAAWGLSRARMDEAMLSYAAACGVLVHDHQACIRVSGDLLHGFSLRGRDTRTGLQDTYVTRTVISAHGKRSTMDRLLGRRFLGHHYPLIGMKRHFRGPPIPDGVALHAFAGGYCGLANIEEGLVNLCFLIQEGTFKSAFERVRQPRSDTSMRDLQIDYGGRDARNESVLAMLASRNPVLADWLRRAEANASPGQSVGALAFGVRGTDAHDILNVGDAAGLIAPLTGDGIGMALQSGTMCAQHVMHYLNGKSHADDLKQGYARDWHTVFAGRIRLAGALQSLAFQPSLLRVLLQVLPHVPALGQWLVQKTRSASVR
jgi:flavin-dependent dehydrogenase